MGINACNEENGWDDGPGPHPGPLSCEERCDYFAEDIMWMCIHEVAMKSARSFPSMRMICMDECESTVVQEVQRSR